MLTHIVSVVRKGLHAFTHPEGKSLQGRKWFSQSPFIAMKSNSIFHWPFSLQGAMSGARVGPRAPGFVSGIEPGTFSLRNLFFPLWCLWSSCSTVFVELNAGGNDSFGIAVISGLYRSQRGHRKIKLLK